MATSCIADEFYLLERCNVLHRWFHRTQRLECSSRCGGRNRLQPHTGNSRCGSRFTSGASGAFERCGNRWAVRQPGTYYSMVPPPDAPPVLVGAKIDVSGPAGTTTVTTDGSGVYQLDGLEAGEYTVRLHVPEGQVAGLTRGNGTRPDESVRKILLKKDELKESNFYLDWDRKEGEGRQ